MGGTAGPGGPGGRHRRSRPSFSRDGWAKAWQSFAKQNPAAVPKVLATLAAREAELAGAREADAARLSRQAREARAAGSLAWLGEDLLLLALDAGRGSFGRIYGISYGLMGAELVRLAACGRIDIVDDQVVVRSPAPTGDADLDAALARIGEPTTSPWWVPRPGIISGYRGRLVATGVICIQRGSGKRWRITQAEARQRLDLIACSVGPVDLSQTAYAALVCALGLDRLLYPGGGRRAERDRLREIAAGHWTTSPARASDSADATAASVDASNGPDRAAIDAATLAAIHAAACTVFAALNQY